MKIIELIENEVKKPLGYQHGDEKTQTLDNNKNQYA